ncbi:MAG: class I SAM-dependent methyltransferase [Actinomycetota bacterium]|nr:class I SAM-dependent methyltransferase [Actinomycetota bacterium]
MTRLAATAQAQYFPTPDRVTTAIARYISPAPTRPGETIRLLDPCAGEGHAAAQLAAWLGAESYGIELNAQRAREAEARLGRLLCHDALWGVRLGTGSMSAMLLNPPYDHDQEKKRLEHAFLTQLTRVLAPGGVLALLIPQRRLVVSARYLASHYENLACYRFPDPEYGSYKQVVLFATRRAKAEADHGVQARIEGWAVAELPQLPDVPGSDAPMYVAPALPRGEVLFGVAGFDPQKAASEARRKGVWAAKLLGEELWPAQERPVRPCEKATSRC